MKKLTFAGLFLLVSAVGAFAQTPTPTPTPTATPSFLATIKSGDLNPGPGTFISGDKVNDLRSGLNRLVVLTDSATITASPLDGNVQAVMLGATGRTFTWGTAHKKGEVTYLMVQQDTGGSRTITTWTGIKWPGNTAPTLSTGAGKTDLFAFLDNGVTWSGWTVGLNYPQ